ncbi:condensation domain-containing protein [Salinactinospora qingdaonensis]|uniref:Phthiocerol/phthiodiolone dimycocerosyl transferase n=1 Tax=Salinactinospora qingdaonensis TaxID=702744 RepID=A0ABP7FEZ3_9ACTN
MTEIDRPLSGVERWYWLCDQFSPLNVIARVRVHGALSPEAMRRGLDALQARHPLLRTAIEQADDGTSPRWVPAQGRPIPLRHVTGAADGQWVDEVNEHELAERVDWRTGPMMRATIVSAPGEVHDLLVIVPHIIADGTTVLTLARQWLELAATAVTAPPRPGAERALPPPDAMLPERHRGTEGADRLAEQTARDEATMTQYQPGRIEPTVQLPLEQRRTKLVHRELTGAQLDAVLRACQRENTTVHGALTAAMVQAAARDADQAHTHVAIGSPIDFRDGLVPPVAGHEVGTYVATVPSVISCTADLWEAARAVNADLSRRKTDEDHFCLVNMVSSQCPESLDQARPFLEFMEKNGPINLCASNIGRYDFPDTIGDWQLSDAQFLTGISVNGYFVATINTSHGRLFWNFTYIAEAIPDARARHLADDCLATLLSATAEHVHPTVEPEST